MGRKRGVETSRDLRRAATPRLEEAPLTSGAQSRSVPVARRSAPAQASETTIPVTNSVTSRLVSDAAVAGEGSRPVTSPRSTGAAPPPPRWSVSASSFPSRPVPSPRCCSPSFRAVARSGVCEPHLSYALHVTLLPLFSLLSLLFSFHFPFYQNKTVFVS